MLVVFVFEITRALVIQATMVPIVNCTIVLEFSLQIHQCVRNMDNEHCQIHVLAQLGGLALLALFQFAMDCSQTIQEFAIIKTERVPITILVHAIQITSERSVKYQFVLEFQQTLPVFVTF